MVKDELQPTHLSPGGEIYGTPEHFNLELPRSLVVHALRSAFQRVLRTASVKDSHSILEVGCGSGFTYRELLPDKLKGQVVGIDIDRDSLEQFRQRSPEA